VGIKPETQSVPYRDGSWRNAVAPRASAGSSFAVLMFASSRPVSAVIVSSGSVMTCRTHVSNQVSG